MANLLTAAEAASILKCETNDPVMLILLDILDAFVNNDTGRDWTLDHPIHPIAKDAAMTLLVNKHEDPGAMNQSYAMDHYRADIVKLQAIALEEQ